jgi:hypothetical protein
VSHFSSEFFQKEKSSELFFSRAMSFEKVYLTCDTHATNHYLCHAIHFGAPTWLGIRSLWCRATNETFIRLSTIMPRVSERQRVLDEYKGFLEKRLQEHLLRAAAGVEDEMQDQIDAIVLDRYKEMQSKRYLLKHVSPGVVSTMSSTFSTALVSFSV